MLVAAHHAPIYRLLARLCRDGHLAEDLTQETFAAAWTKIESYAGTSSLSTWLHAIAYRKYLDARRRRGLATVTDRAYDVNEAASPTVTPLDTLVADEESRRLHEALGRLPPNERDALVLHYLQGLTYREMAHVLDEPSGTVKWRTSRALDNLKQLLGEKSSEGAETTISTSNGYVGTRRSLAIVVQSAGT
jgi:RNA polymerase sigma-70 factor, ECF subfamily